MRDKGTVDIYDEKAAEYAGLVAEHTRTDPDLLAFIDMLPPAAAVLDLGCGPGHASAVMAQAGHQVTALDASAEMVRMAARIDGVTARQEDFDALSGTGIYDGVWASFSLLHAPRADIPRHLAALRAALRPGGAFSIGVKLGTGSARDSIGRLYTYFTDDELSGLLTDAGLTITDRSFGTSAGLSGEMADWIVIRARG